MFLFWNIDLIWSDYKLWELLHEDYSKGLFQYRSMVFLLEVRKYRRDAAWFVYHPRYQRIKKLAKHPEAIQ
jgi:hypothetical protein